MSLSENTTGETKIASQLRDAVSHRLNYAATKYRMSSQWSDLARTTKRNYDKYIGYMFDHFGQYTDLRTLNTSMIKVFLDTMADRPKVAANALIVLRNVIKHADLPDDPSRTITLGSIRGPTLSKREKVYVNRAKQNGTTVQEEKGAYAAWTEEDFWKFTSLCQKINVRMFCIIARYTGQRTGDVLAMKWSQVNMSEKHITLQQEKTGKTLLIPIHPILERELALHARRQKAVGAYKEDGFVIANLKARADIPLGSGYLVSTISHAVTRETQDILGKYLAPHGLRRLMAISLAEKGASEYQIMSVTGHVSPSSVRQYVVDAQQKKLAEEAMKKLL